LARPISDEELQLKKRARRRLVGAIVLVSVVAVVLPMVLDSEPKQPSQKVDIQIPSTDSSATKSRASSVSSSTSKSTAGDTSAKVDATPKSEPLPTPEPGAKSETSAKQEPAAGSKPDAANAAAEHPATGATATVAETKTAASVAPAEKPKESATAKAAPKNGASAKTANGAYVVQVAALADAGKAKELQKRMASAGVKTYTEVITTSTGEVTRVRAGPYATKDAAEKARAQLKKAGLEGKIVPK
jgi:DedD protein